MRSRGARHYISKLGRWMTVDPLAAKYPGWSTYNYVKCNPLILLDLKGEEVWVSSVYTEKK
ncbi:MAG: RHS repeat-associated core domain-containing protein [bacterium]